MRRSRTNCWNSGVSSDCDVLMHIGKSVQLGLLFSSKIRRPTKTESTERHDVYQQLHKIVQRIQAGRRPRSNHAVLFFERRKLFGARRPVNCAIRGPACPQFSWRTSTRILLASVMGR